MSMLAGSVVVTAVRNEGPFLLQWVAWQRMLGFADILVVHNDCTDHSPQLLRLLERHGVLTQKAHQPDPALPPQPQSHAIARRHPLVTAADWAFVCDVDEYLVIHRGEGTVADLLDGGTLPAAGLAIHWRVFGTMGEEAWADRLMHRHFTRAAPRHANQNSCFKSFARRPRDWDRLRAHGPKGWRGPGAWNAGDNVIWLADGTPLTDYSPDGKPLNSTPKEAVVHDWAQVNHYALQSREQFLHKRGQPCAAEFLDRYSEAFFTRFDRNEEEDLSALEYAARFDAEYAAITAIPGVLRLHHLCCADFVEAMNLRQRLDPAEDPRIAEHRARAAALPRH